MLYRQILATSFAKKPGLKSHWATNSRNRCLGCCNWLNGKHTQSAMHLANATCTRNAFSIFYILAVDRGWIGWNVWMTSVRLPSLPSEILVTIRRVWSSTVIAYALLCSSRWFHKQMTTVIYVIRHWTSAKFYSLSFFEKPKSELLKN